jgi:hypothetical protein
MRKPQERTKDRCLGPPTKAAISPLLFFYPNTLGPQGGHDVPFQFHFCNLL